MMKEVDITIEGWDPHPTKLWLVILSDQPNPNDTHFRLFHEADTVLVRKFMFNGEEVVKWDPELSDQTVLFDYCKESISLFVRKKLEEYIDFSRPASQINLYLIRDNFTMTFGVALTSDPKRLSEDESYDIEEFSTLSAKIWRNEDEN